MLPRTSRLTTRQFDLVMKKGRVVHSSFFLARVLEGQVGTRFSAVVPVKVSKKATDRNRIRRAMYDHIARPLNSITVSCHVAIFAKIDTTTKPSADVFADLKALFVKAGILR